MTQSERMPGSRHPFAVLREAVALRLRSPGARRWYFGSLWGLAYLAIPIILTWVSGANPVSATLLTIHVVVLGVVYVVLPPLLWGRPWQIAAVAYTAFLAYTCLAIPLIGVNTVWLWLYVPIMAAMSWLPATFTVVTIAVVLLAQLVVVSATDSFADYWYAMALTASISVMMLTFGEQIKAIRRLRDAQGEIARLAVVDERERFARDMHDVLGHSLTVVTVKSELARKLVARDPERAEAELADIERLARAALADVRASVAGYRAMTLETELSAANAALVAADVVPHLPASADVVAPELRETFAWVLREAVTNVVRHARAKNCWVALEKRAIIIGDDGLGMPGSAIAARSSGPASESADGHGLVGLRERVAKVGGAVRIEPGEDGGTHVIVRVPVRGVS
ncbi:sensor histidine kinase [Rathayibacter sp. KR2-224]|uniref:sensor histidine kinase n=1 Tax=Rathayibacter sp. KR2-224 TaxID=3400913 RepID=UPI003C0012A0